MLYPLKFLPLFKNKIWGGNRIAGLGFDYSPLENCGEMWILSGVKDNESVVAGGALEGNNLSELLEIFMGDLVGEANYKHFGTDFPLLIKIIDAAEDLSIQVHPDDVLARSRGMENGKSEMWYVMQTEEGSKIIDGFKTEVTQEEYEEFLRLGKIETILNEERPQAGDVYHIPAGRVHALGKGLMVAEIQQTSDCTYRIYDYNRKDAKGNLRELHTAEALAAIDFHPTKEAKTRYDYEPNRTAKLVDTPEFTTSLIVLDKPMRKDFSDLDSFVVYICIDGIAAVKALESIEPIHAGECVLLPAMVDNVELFAQGTAKLLEVYVDPKQYVGPDRVEGFDWLAEFTGEEADEEDCHCGHGHSHCDCGDDDCHCHEH